MTTGEEGRAWDYRDWFGRYDRPESGLPWRLGQVQRYLNDALDAHPGPVRIISACAGDGRDVAGVLAARPADTERCRATLLELDPEIADRARALVAGHGLSSVDVRTANAGESDSFADLVPADVVLLVGIFGNITPADIRRTIATAPQFCRPGATLVWSRGVDDEEDLNPSIRGWFAAAGFSELDYAMFDGAGDRPALGAVRYDGPATPLVAGRHLFSFFR
jgi:hypothetical protein